MIFGNENSKTPKGSLAGLNLLGGSDLVGGGGESSESAWSRIWSARKEWDFRVKSGDRVSVVFMDNVQILMGYQVLTGYTNYPRKDVVASTAHFVNDQGELEETGQPDVFGKVLGLKPRPYLVGSVLDISEGDSKVFGDTRKGIVRPIVVNNEIVQKQLYQAAADTEDGSLLMAVFDVSRSAQPKSPKTGDFWTARGTVTMDKIREQAGLQNFELTEKNAIDLDAAYPILSPDDAISVLNLHCKVYDQHRDKLEKNGKYDPSMLEHARKKNWAAFSPDGAPAAPAQEESTDLFAPTSTEAAGGGIFDDLAKDLEEFDA